MYKMPLGITNTTNVTLQNLTDIATFTDPIEFYINVNQIVYGGWLFFIIMWVFCIIMYRALQEKSDQPLINLMAIFAVATIVSLFYRAIVITKFGITQGLLTDHQLWVFPLLTAILAAINISIKDK